MSGYYNDWQFVNHLNGNLSEFLICVTRLFFRLFEVANLIQKLILILYDIQKVMYVVDGVPEEIVKRKHVTDGFQKLLQKKARSIVVLGKIGNSVLSTSRLISETFTKKEKWQSRECRYTDIPKTVEKNTIMYVYGWFGMWNDDLCSESRVELACKSLIQILKETTNVKIIIGMRSDLYKKYHKELDEAVNLKI